MIYRDLYNMKLCVVILNACRHHESFSALAYLLLFTDVHSFSSIPEHSRYSGLHLAEYQNTVLEGYQIYLAEFRHIVSGYYIVPPALKEYSCQLFSLDAKHFPVQILPLSHLANNCAMNYNI